MLSIIFLQLVSCNKKKKSITEDTKETTKRKKEKLDENLSIKTYISQIHQVPHIYKIHKLVRLLLRTQ